MSTSYNLWRGIERECQSWVGWVSASKDSATVLSRERWYAGCPPAYVTEWEREAGEEVQRVVSDERLIFVIIVKFFKSWYCYELHLNFECSMTCLLIHLLWFMLYVHFRIKVKFLLVTFNYIIHDGRLQVLIPLFS